MKKPASASTAVSVSQLRTSLAELTTKAISTTMTPRHRRALDGEVRMVMAELGKLLHELDPIRQPSSMFDPGNPKVIGRFIALAMVAQQRVPLATVEPFYGSGVYAIYYKGPFELYASISGSETPIYVGQAAPATSNARTAMEQGDKLTKRLSEHRKNIAKAHTTLDIADFECRALVVQSGWETAAEDYLIHLFQPIWNSETDILYGLGKHGDDPTTRANKRSPWDTLHPGRQWAVATKEDARTPSKISADLAAHFLANRAYQNLDAVLRDFVDELRQI